MAKQQLTLDFEGGLTRRYKTLLDLLAAGSYRHGLQRCASAVDQAPSNLSAMLSGQRHFPVDRLGDWIEETGDLTPVYWLVEKYLEPPESRRDQVIQELSQLVPEIQRLLQAAKGSE